MVLPNWFKVTWWAFLLIGVGSVLYLRLPAITSGTAAPIDVVVFLLWVALFLAPVFKEVNFFGLKLKQQVNELKNEMAGLRNDIRNSIDVRTQISPVFHAPAPPPDSQLQAEGQVLNLDVVGERSGHRGKGRRSCNLVRRTSEALGSRSLGVRLNLLT